MEMPGHRITPGFAALHYFRLRFEVVPCRPLIIEIKMEGAGVTAQSPTVICSLWAKKGRRK